MSQDNFEVFVAVSTGHFDPLIQHCDGLRERYRFFGQIGSGVYSPQFPFVRTLPLKTLREVIDRSPVVVTHAGTGMLSLCYEMNKKVVVIPKQKRYGELNDGQVELAKKWGQLGLGVLCMEVERLAESIETARALVLQKPQFPALGKNLIKFLDP